MSARRSSNFLWVSAIILLLLAGSLAAQAPNAGTVRGRITDPTGAVVPQTTITITTSAGEILTAVSKGDGTYEVKNVAPGKFTVKALAKGFAPFEQADGTLAAGQVLGLDIALAIEVEKQVVNVADQATNVDVDPSNNASSVVLKGKDLEALSDDPDQLQADLEALAGPSAGPNGGQIYIDGFSNGQLPPKSAIREVRINQNPFSAEFDHIGFGRIEIFTKPGQDKFRGSFMTNLNNSVLNSKNPFVTGETPGYHSQQFAGNFSGPINRKASFFFNMERRDINDSSIINAYILDSNFNPTSYSAAVLNPQMRMSIGPRLDYQLSKKNTLTARYHLRKATWTNDSIGGFSLADQASNRESWNQELQISDSQMISDYTINETRFEYERDRSTRSVLNFQPTISVADAFTSGGNSGGFNNSHGDNIELQNTTMQTRGTHFLKWGGRFRYDREANYSNSGYNGVFSFPSIYAYQLVQKGLAQGLTTAQVRAQCVADLGTNASLTQLLNCGPNQFSLTSGLPAISISQADLGAYFSDDWRLRRNLTLSYGLRFETQNNIHDHADFAPRLAIAWGIGRAKGTPKTVLRAGIGMFYDRFSMNNVLMAEQLDGVHQQRYVIQATPVNPTSYPDFYPLIPTAAQLQGFLQTQAVYHVDPNLRAPYMVQGAVSIERQITKASTVSVNYVQSRGLHQISTFNVNAPLNGVLPEPNSGPIYQFVDDGIYKQRQLMIMPNIRISSAISLHSFYVLSWANGTPNTPSNPYSLMADYGRSMFDVRQRFMVMGNVSLPMGFSISPNVMATAGRPFNITIGQDLNGDSYFNDRPSFANPSNTDPGYLKNVIETKYGLLNMVPLPGEKIIPINYGTGPGTFMVGMRISKTFALGRKAETVAQGPGMGGPGGPGGYHDHGPGGGGPGGGGPRGGGGFVMMRGGPMGGGSSNRGRYSLTISADSRNLLNHVNYSNPISNLTAGDRFGTYTSIQSAGFGGTAANRRITFQAMFSF